jgi:hypothetical protein
MDIKKSWEDEQIEKEDSQRKRKLADHITRVTHGPAEDDYERFKRMMPQNGD